MKKLINKKVISIVAIILLIALAIVGNTLAPSGHVSDLNKLDCFYRSLLMFSVLLIGAILINMSSSLELKSRVKVFLTALYVYLAILIYMISSSFIIVNLMLYVYILVDIFDYWNAIRRSIQKRKELLKLNNISLVLNIVCSLCVLSDVTLNLDYTNGMCAILVLLSLIPYFVIAYRNKGSIVLDIENEKGASRFKNGKLRYGTAVLLASIALSMKFLFTSSFLNVKIFRVLLYSLICSIVVIGIYLIIKRNKEALKTVPVILGFSILFFVGFINDINNSFVIEEKECVYVVVDKVYEHHRDGKYDYTPDYYIEIECDGKKVKAGVSYKYYESYEIGDEVKVIDKTGLFGLDYQVIKWKK